MEKILSEIQVGLSEGLQQSTEGKTHKLKIVWSESNKDTTYCSGYVA